jgi:Ni/Fe-hydrogenase subunit HybB-like protein
MTIFESWHSSRAFGRALEVPLLASMGRVLAVLMSAYLWLRFLDLTHRGVFGLLLQNRMETWLFLLEIALMAVPTVLLFSSRVRFSPGALYGCAVMIVFGFVANRLNVGVTALESGSGVHYVPRWSEIAVTLSIIAVGFAIFRVIAQQFPVFEAESEHVASAVGMRKRLPHQVETVEERIEVG